MPTIHIPSPLAKEGQDVDIENIDRVEHLSITSGSIIHLKNGLPVHTGLTPEQIAGMIKDVE